MIDYQSLIDVTYIEHLSNEAYRQEYLESFRGAFTPRAVKGIDNSLEYGRRACIDSCNKKYIMLNDTDDIYSPDAIKKAIEFLEVDKEMKYCAVAAKESMFSTRWTDKNWNNNLNSSDVTQETLKRNICSMHNFVVYRADVLKESVRDFKTEESNYDYAFKKNLLSGGRVTHSLGMIGALIRVRTDGKNWLSRVKNK